MTDRQKDSGLGFLFGGEFDIVTFTDKALGRKWIAEGEDRTREMASFLKDARFGVELALSLYEVNLFTADAEILAILEETSKSGVPVTIAFDREGIPDEVNPALLDLARKNPNSFIILECDQALALHFGVVDGTRVMIEKPA